jgi:hypothetical protein
LLPLARTFAQVSLLVLLFASRALAQQSPAWEFFGGYSFERSPVRQYFKSTPILYTFRESDANLNGWELAVTENLNSWFGGTLQATGHYVNPVAAGTTNHVKMFSIMYGPRFAHRTRHATPYAHLLFGASHSSVTVSPGPHASETIFAIGAGGGLDVSLGEHMSVRALQIQYSPMNPVVTKDHNFQASAGVVFYVGSTK